ncbi:hypothetical protein N7474_001555 [Penicillium riverlandense]|uniref:uncharacterized protein n=1 Tax=Penicillium riverlandense TaxID=1903569 RepID=UPI002549964D|nr:uncharacterized protein N7474_001555 [Penicillium riverlandense]KAJ5833244.1 hypothetical protein N7474_001555 [Penicillium riverlandense]
MIPSSPSFPSSFDPALHLHSQDDIAPHPPSESFADDLEVLNLQRLEHKRDVIQHRAWDLADVFRSDDDIRPGLWFLVSSPPVARMPFISSPGALAPTRAARAESQKRKASDVDDVEDGAQSTEQQKRPRMLGGFLADDDDDEEDDDIPPGLGDEQFKSQFELQEYVLESGPAPIIAEPPETTNEPTPTPTTTPSLLNPLPARQTAAPQKFQIKTCAGKTHSVSARKAHAPVSYERIIASRSETAPGRAKTAYYGIEIHKLLDDAAKTTKQTSDKTPPAPVQQSIENPKQSKRDHAMWTEKYRARKFTDLIGDERTHRAVLRWLKGWDPIVFPGLAKAQARAKKQTQGDEEEERMHRKVLLLSGPPGLGKTTLAHVCAKQAGYEVLEINASDDRSKDVVKGRIRDALGTENVKGMNVEVGEKKIRRAGKPVCVVVDEVDGVVGGSGSGGEGGFMKALIDLVLLDQRNSARSAEQHGKINKKRKGDTFRFLRPLILICNDLYHTSLRPLRASSVAEMIHVRHAPLENVVQRVKNIFTREGIPCDSDGARRLCEASWGLAARRQRGSKSTGSAEGDIRSVLVAAEWVAHKLRNELTSPKLTRTWLEQRVLSASTEGSSFFKELSRGGVREIVNRVFAEGAGFSDDPVGTTSFQDRYDGPNSRTPVGVADLRKRHAINRLREMVEASGDHDRCVSECFAVYPIQEYQDDTFLSKPNAAYDWLHFHDSISSKVYSSHEWELGPYLSQSVVAFHHLFASAAGKTDATGQNPDEDDAEEDHPFSGPKADYAAFEAQKQNRQILNGFHSSFSAPLLRMFRSPENVITELVPHVMRMLSPDVKPVIVRGGGDQRSVASVRKESERALVQAAVRVMAGLEVTFEKVRVEHDGGSHGGWVYRMEPPIDSLVSFSKTKGSSMASAGPVRYAVRQVLDQEYRKETMRKQSDHLSMNKAGAVSGGMKQVPGTSDAAQKAMEAAVKRDFFGRVIQEPASETGDSNANSTVDESSKAGRKVWVTFHEGFSNAVRKPISLGELLAGL